MLKTRDTADRSKRNLKEPVEIIWDNLDFSWTESEMNKAIDMWRRGRTLKEICEELRPHTPKKLASYELTFLIIYLCDKNKIKQRAEGLGI